MGNYTMQFTYILREVGNQYSPTLIKIAEMEHFFYHVQNFKSSGVPIWLYSEQNNFVLSLEISRTVFTQLLGDL